jgi:hypothetical protein
MGVELEIKCQEALWKLSDVRDSRKTQALWS